MSRLSLAVSSCVCKIVMRSECSLACISTINWISSVYLVPIALFDGNELFRSRFKTSIDVVNGLLNSEKDRSSLTFGLLWRFCLFDNFSAPTISLLVPIISELLPPPPSPIFDDDSSFISTSHRFWVVFCLCLNKQAKCFRTIKSTVDELLHKLPVEQIIIIVVLRRNVSFIDISISTWLLVLRCIVICRQLVGGWPVYSLNWVIFAGISFGILHKLPNFKCECIRSFFISNLLPEFRCSIGIIQYFRSCASYKYELQCIAFNIC